MWSFQHCRVSTQAAFTVGIASFFVATGLSFAPSAAEASSPAEQMLTRDLMVGTATMDRDTRIYHYMVLGGYRPDTENLEQVLEWYWKKYETEESRRTEIVKYMNDVTGRFWNLDYVAEEFINAGAGIYLASDPHVSINFGQGQYPWTKSAMLEMTIPKGTRYLSVIQNKIIQPDTLIELEKEGYVNDVAIQDLFKKEKVKNPLFFRDTLRDMTKPKYRIFRALVQRIFSAQNIQLIEYNWQTSLEGFCRKHTQSAFNFIGRPPQMGLDPAYISTPMAVIPNLPNLSSEEVAFLERTEKFKRVLGRVAELHEAKAKIPKGLVLTEYSEAEVRELKSKAFKCQ
jgi:hypothetical protein